jgi:small conductance mechanosensitive channel
MLTNIQNFLTGQLVINLLTTLIFLVLGWFAIKLICALLRKFFDRNNTLDPSVEKMLLAVVRGALLFVLFLGCADHLGFSTTSVITLAGSLGLAFSLAMQNSLANVAGGIFILTSKPFVTGDFIESGDVSGTVTSIGFIHTMLNTVNNQQIYVPNGTISAANIINYSREARRRVDLSIPVPYDCSLEKAKRVITEAVSKESRIEADPFIRTWNLNAHSVEIMVRAWCSAADYWEVRSNLLELIKLALDDNGIAIPFNQLDVHICNK